MMANGFFFDHEIWMMDEIQDFVERSHQGVTALFIGPIDLRTNCPPSSLELVLTSGL